MLSISQLTEQQKSSSTITGRRSTFYESASLSVFEKVINQDYTEYQLKNFINSRTSGEGFKEAVKGGLEKIWKFIKGIFSAILKGLDNFWQTIRKIFSRKKNKEEKKQESPSTTNEEISKIKSELASSNKENERLANELKEAKEQLKKVQEDTSSEESMKNSAVLKIKETKTELEESKKRIESLKKKLAEKEINSHNQMRRIESLEATARDMENMANSTKKTYDSYKARMEEKYGLNEIKDFLRDLSDISSMITSLTSNITTIVGYLTQDGVTFRNSDPNGKVYIDSIPENPKKGVEPISGIGTYPDKIIGEIERRLDSINVDKVKELLSKGFYLTEREIDLGTSLPRDAWSAPYDALRTCQLKLARSLKKIQKRLDQNSDMTSPVYKSQNEDLQLLMNKVNITKKLFDKYKRHLVSFAIAIEPILDEKAKGYFRGIR